MCALPDGTRIYVAAILAGALILSGCGDPQETKHLTELRDYVWKTPFPETYDPVNKFWRSPEVLPSPPHLMEFVRANYDRDVRVRRLLAVYFLRYDSALLDRGLISCQAGPDTLLGLLWEKEMGENISMGSMRRRIADGVVHFGFDEDTEAQALDLLRSNERKFAELVKFWETGRHDKSDKR